MLAEPIPQFLYEYDDTTAGTANTTTMGTGVAVTAGAANTKGSWAQIIASAANDIYGFWLIVSAAVSPAGLNASQLLDIGVGAAASEVVLMPNILVGGQSPISGAISFGSYACFVPLFIAKGARVSARTQSATASRVARVHFWDESGSSVPRPVYSGCDTFGADTANSAGVALPSNASANTFGAATNIGAAATRDYRGLLVSTQGPSLAAVTARQYIVEAGYGSTFAAKMRLLAGAQSSETWSVVIPAQVAQQSVPSGTQLQARIACSAASNTEQPTAVIHAFY